MIAWMALLACAGGVNPPATEEVVEVVEVVEEEPAVPPPAGEPATDAAGLAAQLTRAEELLRDPRFTADQVRPHGHLQQRIYRIVGEDEALSEAVHALVPEHLRAVVRKNLEATNTSRATVRKPREKMPTWRITDPAPADELMVHYQEAERAYGTPWEILAAIHCVETRMGRLHGTSWAGARGPMQFMPATWARYGQGYQDSDRDSILAAGRYLADVGVLTDPERAVWDYNHSDRYVKAVLTFASVMEADPMAYRGYWSWEVYYLTTHGSLHLPAGYTLDEAVTVESWCADHPCPASPQ